MQTTQYILMIGPILFDGDMWQRYLIKLHLFFKVTFLYLDCDLKLES